ncbi:MAG: ABC transporter substrate-binding protein [Deltaproteobacteria bacterium]|nr:ABC transporter substrate-binding protein [Deltaproteobacteria bacterium]
MSFTKMQIVLAKILGMTVFILAAALVMIPAAAYSDAGGKPVWDKRYKYTWMKWGQEYWPTKPVRGGYFRTAAARYVGYMNPNHWPVNDWTVISHFYEGITGTDGKYNQKNPWLMAYWEYPDPLTVIMKFKEGIKFHDGSPMNAASVKYQIEWMKDKRNGCWTRADLRRFKSIEVVDEYRLRWRTKEPWASFPTGFFAFIISAEALKGDVLIREAKNEAARAKRLKKQAAASGKEEDRKAAARAEEEARAAAKKAEAKKSTDHYPLGTGPFILEEARPGNYVKVKRNPNWWFGRSVGHPDMPYFDGVKTTVIPDPSIQLANLRAGKIDSMVVNKALYIKIKNDPNFNVHVFPHYTVRALSFNHAEGPCQDIRVRQAVSHAIDRKALIHGTQFGLGRIASCLFPGNHWAHNPNLKPLSYDPELSRRLLADAGYKDGLKLKGHMGNSPEATALTEAIKAMLTKVGVNWKVEALDPVAMTDKRKNREYDLCVGDVGYIQDPDSFVNWLYGPTGSFNWGRSNNPKVIPLIEAGRIELDQEKRARIYHQLEEAIYENYEDVWMWWEMVAMAYRKSVQGFNYDMYLKDLNLYSYSHPLWFKDGRP